MNVIGNVIGIWKPACDRSEISSTRDSSFSQIKRKNKAILGLLGINPIFALPKRDGAVAQLVEQRTENPCVAGSIPAHTTKNKINAL
jgi:hypothetical protein